MRIINKEHPVLFILLLLAIFSFNNQGAGCKNAAPAKTEGPQNGESSSDIENALSDKAGEENQESAALDDSASGDPCSAVHDSIQQQRLKSLKNDSIWDCNESTGEDCEELSDADEAYDDLYISEMEGMPEGIVCPPFDGDVEQTGAYSGDADVPPIPYDDSMPLTEGDYPPSPFPCCDIVFMKWNEFYDESEEDFYEEPYEESISEEVVELGYLPVESITTANQKHQIAAIPPEGHDGSAGEANIGIESDITEDQLFVDHIEGECQSDCSSSDLSENEKEVCDFISKIDSDDSVSVAEYDQTSITCEHIISEYYGDEYYDQPATVDGTLEEPYLDDPYLGEPATDKQSVF